MLTGEARQVTNSNFFIVGFKETVPNLKRAAIACFEPDSLIDGRQKHGFDESRPLFVALVV